ncbi:Arginine deiminase [Aduncisulcus paluster]|uniref:Arginine deiminase n=1 Tax=Aduncisulcus paluster TaxID=2918883 RepID=A0ABQ5JYW4_9EUKA|nr:Arginine deiminase [Aduncisulcus paluster]|eukprot:gnl/Carplike_NY0171/4305_a5835_266.p1 GENE.gnl/Carplike_NY0171/4305_a5835_266~~gnl/Carplike_NY0171/4305_a5835_266.p1  ORF type:complete len:659 (-),score=191.06 gnl/Carplike_NY0171/4305_a5835_266:199-2175(-)
MKSGHQFHEDDTCELVILHDPGIGSYLNSLHPAGALFEKPLSTCEAKKQHNVFRKLIEESGAKVLTVREILRMDVDKDMVSRVNLEELALTRLTYQFVGSNGLPDKTHTPQEKYYVSDEYKREVLRSLDIERLVDVVLLNPTIKLTRTAYNTGMVTQSTELNPAGNLLFTRDQQITTGSGVVMCNMASSQRSHEIAIMEFCFKKLGINPIGRVSAPGTLEGGDFMMCGPSLAMVGVGLRTNSLGASYLMDNDLLGTDRLAVVRDIFDRNQDRLHLDCVFAPLGRDICLLDETIIGAANPKRRLVDVYCRTKAGRYVIEQSQVEFSQFLKSEGFHIIPVPHKLQLAYGVNVLNLGDSRILTVNDDTARLVARDPHFKGTIQSIDFRAVTSMFGSMHCCSQCVIRSPAKVTKTMAFYPLPGEYRAKEPSERPIDLAFPSIDCIIKVPTFCADTLGLDRVEEEKMCSEGRELLEALEDQGINVRVEVCLLHGHPQQARVGDFVKVFKSKARTVMAVFPSVKETRSPVLCKLLKQVADFNGWLFVDFTYRGVVLAASSLDLIKQADGTMALWYDSSITEAQGTLIAELARLCEVGTVPGDSFRPIIGCVPIKGGEVVLVDSEEKDSTEIAKKRWPEAIIVPVKVSNLKMILGGGLRCFVACL